MVDTENCDPNKQEVAFTANSQELLDMVKSEGIIVTKKEDSQRVPIESGQEAFYALLAQDMLQIA